MKSLELEPSFTRTLGEGFDAAVVDVATPIEHHITKAQMTFVATLPDHMARTWKLMDWKEGDVPADPFATIR